MNFDHRRHDDEPEVNLIPLIDVLLVILIFLAASTSFTRTRQLQVALPQAQAEALDTRPALTLAISQDGQFALDGHYIELGNGQSLAQALRAAAQAQPGAALNIDADGRTPHATVVQALEAARVVGIGQIHFLTQFQP